MLIVPAVSIPCTAEPSLRLRPIVAGDDAFLLSLYAQVRARELAHAPWTKEEKHAFVADQFRHQRAHYQRVYPAADLWLVEMRGPQGAPQPIGRLSLDRTSDEWRLIEIALLADRRGRGIGTSLVQWVQAEAIEAGAAVSLHVERSNPTAYRLYRRLGFTSAPSRFPTHHFLRWSAAHTPPDAATTARHSAELRRKPRYADF